MRAGSGARLAPAGSGRSAPPAPSTTTSTRPAASRRAVATAGSTREVCASTSTAAAGGSLAGGGGWPGSAATIPAGRPRTPSVRSVAVTTGSSPADAPQRGRLDAVVRAVRAAPPPWLLVSTFVLTCGLGALLLLFGPDWVRESYVYQTAADVPDLSGRDVAVALALIVGAPAATAAGWWLAGRGYGAGGQPSDTAGPERRPALLVAGLAAGLAVLLVRLASAGVLDDLGAWTGYDDLIAARAAAFARLSFADFVLAYTVLPLLAGAAAADLLARPRARLPVAAVAALAVAAAAPGFLLYQKRIALTGLLLAAFVVLCRPLARRALAPSRAARRRAIRLTALAGAVLLAVYLALQLTPIVVDAARPAPSRFAAISFPEPGTLPARSKLENVLWQGTLGGLTRTAGPAIAYPAIYPALHPFYRVDLGLDLIGRGEQPDDNRSSWVAMFGEREGVNVVPYPFAFYAQGGLVVALVLSLVLGGLLRAGWLLLYIRAAGLAAACGGALVLLTCVLAGTDSVRNALLASYGTVWPLLGVLAARAGAALRARRA